MGFVTGSSLSRKSRYFSLELLTSPSSDSELHETKTLAVITSLICHLNFVIGAGAKYYSYSLPNH